MSFLNTCQPDYLPPLRIYQYILGIGIYLPVLYYFVQFHVCALLYEYGDIYKTTYDAMARDKDLGNFRTWGIVLPKHGIVTLSETMTLPVGRFVIVLACLAAVVVAPACYRSSLLLIGVTYVFAALLLDVLITHWRTGGEHHLAAGAFVLTVYAVGLGLLVFNVRLHFGFEIWGTLLVMLSFFGLLFLNHPNTTSLAKKYAASHHLDKVALTVNYMLTCAELGTGAVMLAVFEYVR